MSPQYCVTGSQTHLHLILLFASISSFCDMKAKIDIYEAGTVLQGVSE